MAKLCYKHYADIPHTERIRRIGELIATAVTRYYQSYQSQPAATKRQNNADAESGSAPDSVGLVTDETEKRIIQYLTRVGAATPRDLHVALGVSPMTITRRLARLKAAGIVSVTGKIRSARYQLRNNSSQN